MRCTDTGRRRALGIGALAAAIVSAVLMAALLPRNPAASAAPTNKFSWSQLLPPFTAANDFLLAHGGCSALDVTVGMIPEPNRFFVASSCGRLYRFPATGGTKPDVVAVNGIDHGIVESHGHYYGVASFGSPSGVRGVYEFDPDTLKLTRKLVDPAPNHELRGVVADPLTTDLFVTTDGGMYRISNPNQQPPDRPVLFEAGDFDGIGVSADGNTIYGVLRSLQRIVAYSRQGGKAIFDLSGGGHGPDGIAAVLPGTILPDGTDVSNNLFVNDNDGTLLRVDVNNRNTVSVVASGGVRGDFVVAGFDNCLYATQADHVEQLVPCVFQFPTSPGPVVSLADPVPVSKARHGTTPMCFSVALSVQPVAKVSVTYATRDGTATIGDGDFQRANGQLVFGPTSPLIQTICVNIIGGSDAEPAETFFVDLSSPVNATLGRSAAQGTILKDDGVSTTTLTTQPPPPPVAQQPVRGAAPIALQNQPPAVQAHIGGQPPPVHTQLAAQPQSAAQPQAQPAAPSQASAQQTQQQVQQAQVQAQTQVQAQPGGMIARQRQSQTGLAGAGGTSGANEHPAEFLAQARTPLPNPGWLFGCATALLFGFGFGYRRTMQISRADSRVEPSKRRPRDQRW